MSFSESAVREAVDRINEIFADITGQGSTQRKRRKNSLRYWYPPKNWTKTVYIFGYTPWRTTRDGQSGFFALKYRVMKKDGRWRLVKAVRFGRRKIAKARSLKWYDKYYEEEEKELS